MLSMYLIRIDLVNKMVYNKNEERFIKWLRLMSAKDIEEMKKIGKDDEFMEEAIKYMEQFLEEEGTTLESKIEYEKQKSYDAGEENGKKVGIKTGIIETAKNLLKMNMSKKDISKATGLSKEEIDKLQSN